MNDDKSVRADAAASRAPSQLTRYELQGTGYLVAEGPATEPTKFSGTKVYLAADVEALAAGACAVPSEPHDCTAAILKALKNYGADIECGACMEIAFTGVTTNEHTCKDHLMGSGGPGLCRCNEYETCAVWLDRATPRRPAGDKA